MRLLNTLPQTDEEHYALEVLEIDASVEHGITDDHLAETIPYCPNLQEAYLSGVYDLSDRTLILLGRETDDLRTLDISGCLHVSPIGLHDLAGLATRLQVLRLASVWGTTDPVLKTVLRALGHLTELDIADLPLVTAHSVREVWTFCRTLRVLNLSNCTNITDKAFPSPYADSAAQYPGRRSLVVPDLPAQSRTRTPSPEKPKLWIDDLPPLVLPSHHLLEQLHCIDVSHCQKLTDDAIAGLVQHVPRITELNMAGCTGLSKKVVHSLCTQGGTLLDLDLSEVQRLNDDGVFRLVRACPRLRHLGISYCTQLTDMSIMEVTSLEKLQHLAMAGLPKVTDNSIEFLAEHATVLAQLKISGCTRLSLEAVHRLLRRLKLERLEVSIPAMARPGTKRFSERAPSDWNRKTQGPYRIYRGGNIAALRAFLDKEDARKKDAEQRCIPFTPRADDSMNLY
ncbi:RNI-like protein [Phanerochaete sordida]|uniref:RNI-like protein n=1 Tax=Phanerochaete sordida TaxID=48140 RepID=A0A9P3FYL8_9APHY|nr:RNI-like protein [Phanerochaete sordida]